ncbi:MAG: aminoacyl--tRNA ligase-related protein [Candidatus Saccharimonadales bacterium]
MRLSKLYTKTSKTVPADEVSKNAQLLIKAGFIHKEMAGVYSFLPLGKRVINKISQIVREEMNAIGGQEVQMSILQPKELWEKSNRWSDEVVDNWFKTKLISGHELGIGLTHEEPIANSLIPFVNSYKDLPVYIYQIQSKFRNELRAKSGLMRGREFVMKDMYSFTRNQEDHQAFYDISIEAYKKVYSRLGIGDITIRTFASGGYFSKYSDEFQTLSDIGEDTIFVDESRNVAVNKEVLTDEVLSDIGLERSNLVEKRAVEVGNIFTLGSKYSDAVGLFYLDEDGQKQSICMGCYGIGISRLMGLIAEHFADDKGLVWPKSIAPADIYLARLGDQQAVVQQADDLYEKLTAEGFEVLYDDRDLRVGEKFADADLLGIPYRLVVSNKTVSNGGVELKERTSGDVKNYELSELFKQLSR